VKFQSYFDAEMRALQQLNSENPDHDPSADRILEGVAYLAAQIHQRLDHDFPEIPAILLQQHWPYMLQPYASRTTLEFSSPTKIMLPQHTLVSSGPAGEEKTRCTFSVLQELIIYPIELIKVDINATQLKFCFEAKQANFNLTSLKLYLNTDINTALEIYYAVGQNNAVNTQAESSAQLWLDYFGFREGFLFIALNNLENINLADRFFEVTVALKYLLPPELELNKNNFKINCVPAVNLYTYQAEPILYQSHRADYALIPDNHYPASIVLHSIKNISADYQWDYARNRLIIQDKNIHHNTAISCEIMVSNGYYPCQYLNPGMINIMANKNNLITIKNITRPTPYLLPLDHKDYVWELINCLNINLKKLELPKVLKLFNWSDKSIFKNHIASIISLTHRPIHKISQGAFCHGTEFILALKEEGFRNTAEIYLFGCVLHKYFELISEQNYVIKTQLELYPSSRILLWE